MFAGFDAYNSNQITYNNGVYDIDEDIDSTIDYSFDDPNFSFVQFRSNLVMRWEYIPGSELYFVWSQGITGFVDPMDRLTNGLEQGILNQKPENIFLIKATYRFVLSLIKQLEQLLIAIVVLSIFLIQMSILFIFKYF